MLSDEEAFLKAFSKLEEYDKQIIASLFLSLVSIKNKDLKLALVDEIKGSLPESDDVQVALVALVNSIRKVTEFE